MKRSSMGDERLSVRDLVTVGILTAVFIAVYWTCGMTIGMIPAVWPFLTGVAAVPSGIVILLMLWRVPKRWVYSITGTVTSLVFLATGSWWLTVVIFVASAFLVDLYYAAGNTRSFRRMAISYVLFTLGFTLAAYGPIAFFTETYIRINSAEKYGLSPEYFDFALKVLKGPAVLLVPAAAVLGGFGGALLGRVLLDKHFRKAGVA